MSDPKDTPVEGEMLPEITSDLPTFQNRGDAVPFAGASRPPPAARPTPPAPPPPAAGANPAAATLVGGSIRAHLPKKAPDSTPHHDASAALAGVAAASYAASITERTRSSKRSRAVSHRVRGGAVVDVLWQHETAARRAKQHALWGRVAPRSQPSEWITDGAPARHDDDEQCVARALSHIAPLNGPQISTSLRDAINAQGIFERPVLVVGGTLELTFDAADTLATMAAAARPFASRDPRLAEAVAAAEAATSEKSRSLPAAVEVLRNQLRATFDVAVKGMPPRYLDEAAERCMLEEHRYASFLLFGGRHHRAVLSPAQGHAFPAYVPEPAATMFPLMRAFEVRMLVEPHPRQDPIEPTDIALRVLALARTLTSGS